MSLSQQIKEFALDLGYSRIGFTTADDFTEFYDILISRGQQYDWYTKGGAQALSHTKIRENFPDARSIIALVWDYSKVHFPDHLLDMIGRVYLSRCYSQPEDRINGSRLALMKNYLSRLGCEVYSHRLIPDRWAAARAGTSNFGKNNFAYADGIGSFITISVLIINKELAYDEPTLENQCPANCRKCIDACPSKALYEPFAMNPSQCIAFHTFGFSSQGVVPEDVRESMGTKIHGCDICQEVCPRNQARLKQQMPPDPFLEMIAEDFSLVDVLHMPEGYYETRIEPLMYNYIRNVRLFQRNAAIALGNTQDPAYIPELEKELSSPDEMLRTHIAWALGRIGGRGAASVLNRHLSIETAEQVKKEIERILMQWEP